MTQLMHKFGEGETFDARVQGAELSYLFGSRAASQALAENYVGLPFEGAGSPDGPRRRRSVIEAAA